MPVAGRGISITGNSGHHRFVLSLRYLVFAEIKAFSQGDIMLILSIRLSTRLRRRAAHRKSTRRTPNHIHRHGGIQIHGAVTRYGDRAGGGGGVACGILYGVGE